MQGFAYESGPGPISAGAIPEPSSLSLLAFGATGLAVYRQRRKKVEATGVLGAFR